MTLRIVRALFLPVVLAAFATSCRSPQATFYTLSAASVSAVPPEAAAAPSVVVGPVTVPELVDRPQLVVREAENRVRILETHRWAEPLKSEIPRIVARDLQNLLGSGRVAAYGHDSAVDARYRVLLDLVRLEAAEGQSVTVEAIWTVRGPGGGKLRGRTLVRERVSQKGYEALVAGLSRAISVVSADVAKAIRAAAGMDN